MWLILLPWNVDLVLLCTEFTSVFLNLLRSLWSNMFAALSAWCHLPDVITIHLISLSRLLKKVMNMLRHLQNNTANSCPAWQWTVNNYTQYLFHPGRVSLVCLSKCHVKTIRQLFEVKVDDNVTALPLFKKPIMLSWKKKTTKLLFWHGLFLINPLSVLLIFVYFLSSNCSESIWLFFLTLFRNWNGPNWPWILWLFSPSPTLKPYLSHSTFFEFYLPSVLMKNIVF